MSEEKNNPVSDLNGILPPVMPQEQQNPQEINEIMEKLAADGMMPMPYTIDRVVKWLEAQNLEYKRETDPEGVDHLVLPINGVAFFHFIQNPGDARMVVQVSSVDLDMPREKILEACNEWNKVAFFPKTYVVELNTGSLEARGEYCFLFPEGLHDQLLMMYMNLIFSTGTDMATKIVAYLKGEITDLTAPLEQEPAAE